MANQDQIDKLNQALGRIQSRSANIMPNDANAITLFHSNIDNRHPITTPERTVSDVGTNILTFAKLQKELLNMVWGDDWGTFSWDYPIGHNPDDIPIPCITFDILSRIPSKNKLGLKPRLYDITADEDDPGYVTYQEAKWQDIIIEYSIFHATQTDAYELMDRFELFNTLYTGYYKQNGLMEFLFRQEVPSSTSAKIDSIIPSRCIHYDAVMQITNTQRIRATSEILSTLRVSHTPILE